VKEPLVAIRDLYKEYRRGPEVVHVLDGLSIDIEEGDFVALMGPSGSGKSTLLNLVGGLDRPTAGRLRVQGLELGELSDGALAQWRADNVGFVFQSFHLVPSLNALENVMLPLELAGHEDPRKAARDLIDKVGLADRWSHYPSQLSGGEKQRVAIARAFATGPAVLFADEPTGNLDSRTGDEIMGMFDKLHAEGQTIILVTHEDHIARHALRTIRLRDGKIESDVFGEDAVAA